MEEPGGLHTVLGVARESDATEHTHSELFYRSVMSCSSQLFHWRSMGLLRVGRNLVIAPTTRPGWWLQGLGLTAQWPGLYARHHPQCLLDLAETFVVVLLQIRKTSPGGRDTQVLGMLKCQGPAPAPVS